MILDLHGRARYSTMQHMLKSNLALVATRQVTRLPFCHAFVSRWPIEEKTRSHDRTTQLFPLYIYSDGNQLNLAEANGHRQTALSPEFIARFNESVGNQFGRVDKSNDTNPMGPDRIFFYIYSILYSPYYREQFGSQLMEDFPCIPLPGNKELFRLLSSLGGELVTLHLLESPKLHKSRTEFIGGPNPEVERISWSNQTVWIDGDKSTGFRGVPEAVWNFDIGGYHVCDKWLKDRRGRTLTKDDIAHYQKIVVALTDTIRVMKEIDEVIEAHGGWPGAFVDASQAEH